MAEITTIKMKIGEQEIEMSLDEAKAFQRLLNETFPEPSSPIINPVIIERPYYPGYPIVTWGSACYQASVDDNTLTWEMKA